MDTNQRERGQQPRRSSATGARRRQPQAQTSQRGSAGNKRRTAAASPSLRSTAGTAPSRRRQRASREREAVRARQRRAERQNKPRSTAPAVVYTQPAAFNRTRLLIQLMTVAAVVVALVLGLSIFFRVEVITVSGANVYSEWAVREASGIAEGDQLLTFSRARAGARIRAELPYVDSVRIGIKLPNTVNIVIEELDVVYSIQSSDDLWWLITSEGRIVEQTDGGTASSYTKILGVRIESPKVGDQAVAVEPEIPTAETDAEGNIIGTEPVIVTGEQQLDAALSIVQALEDNDIVGQAASVDVSNIQDIQLWYGQQYLVLLGDTSQMNYKIACMVDTINDPRMDTGYGELDITFTIRKTEVMYTPFE